MKKEFLSEKYSKIIEECVRKNADEIMKMGDLLFHHPEPGFKEVKTNEILSSFFSENGIPYNNKIAMTGIRADLGSGSGYHIALAADMDALLVRDGERSYPYHSCGHSIQTTVLAWIMKMLKDTGIVEELGGSVSFIGTPAEEFIDFDYRQKLVDEGKIEYFSGKQNMIVQGVFDDIDCVLSMHINGDSGETLFDVGSTLAGFMVKKAVFHGRASHSGAAAHLGLNALHGANLCMNAIAFMKDQFPKEANIQIHPVITSCGGGVNTIPEEVVMESYIRANTLDVLMEAGKKFDRCAIHSAEALGLTCDIEDKVGYMPLKQSDQINDVIHHHMLGICSEDRIVKNVISGASGDVGDLGYLVPTVQFGFSGMKGRIHSGDFTIIDPENTYLHTAEVMMKTVVSMLEHPEFRVKNEDYKERRKFYEKNWLHR